MAETMFLLLSTFLALASSASLPRCPTSCGNITIPYPFGIGTGCYRDGFEITCNTITRNNAFPTLTGTDIRVLDLPLELSEARVELPIGWECYNKSGVEDNFLAQIDFNAEGTYRISNTHNQFVVIGCNSLAWIQSKKDNNGIYSYDYYTGCLSYCNDSNSITDDGSCSGVGCCHVAIPSDLVDSMIYFKGYSHDGILSFSPCSFAFLVDKDWFSFGKSNLTMSTNTTVPVWLDWAFRGANNCAQAQLDLKTYGCTSTNSQCYESSNGPGYYCNCSKGYQGNPYLVNGCVDIDECTLPHMYPCNGNCHNMPGSYECTCSSGEHGDPFNGSCTPKFSLGMKLAIGSTCVMIVLVVTVTVLCVCQNQRFQKERDAFKKNGRYELLMSEKVEIMKFFTKEELEKITNNFQTVIGHGGYGKVYKGDLEDRRMVAVKVSHAVDGQSQNKEFNKEFMNEMIILSRVIHKNIVRLLGCCLDGNVPMLAYEFISNGSLQDYLHSNRSHIDLETRLRIGVETAEGLDYLHSSTDNRILHGDVKCANILLSEDYMVKVSDFGTSRFLSKDGTQTTSHIPGTFGYIDPEVLQTGRLTQKSDVYSFGVVLLELITRKKPILGDKSLAKVFVTSMEANNIIHMMDHEISFEGNNLELLKKVGELAVECLRINDTERPTMKEVVWGLEKIRNGMQVGPQSSSFSRRNIRRVQSEIMRWTS